MANKPIGTIGNIPSIEVAGRVFTDLDNLKILRGLVSNSGTTRYASPRDGVATSGYTPSSTNNFRVLAVSFVPIVATAGRITIGYADNDCGSASNTPPTNLVDVADTSVLGLVSAANTRVEYLFDFEVPNGKYIHLDSGGAFSAVIEVFGYEVAP